MSCVQYDDGGDNDDIIIIITITVVVKISKVVINFKKAGKQRLDMVIDHI